MPVSKHHPVFKLREETLRRLKEFQQLPNTMPPPEVMDHILAADALLLDLSVTAHHGPSSNVASPMQSLTSLMRPEDQATLSLHVANVGLMSASAERLRYLNDSCRTRYVGMMSRELQTNLERWNATLNEAERGLVEMRAAGFMLNDVLGEMPSCWPHLINAIEQIETQYQEILSINDSRLRFGRLEIFVVLFSLSVFSIILVITRLHLN
ncbi:hypothetical protein [Bradyrhizobium sp.]